jgi:hypothetical protein
MTTVKQLEQEISHLEGSRLKLLEEQKQADCELAAIQEERKALNLMVQLQGDRAAVKKLTDLDLRRDKVAQKAVDLRDAVKELEDRLQDKKRDKEQAALAVMEAARDALAVQRRAVAVRAHEALEQFVAVAKEFHAIVLQSNQQQSRLAQARGTKLMGQQRMGEWIVANAVKNALRPLCGVNVDPPTMEGCTFLMFADLSPEVTGTGLHQPELAAKEGR